MKRIAVNYKNILKYFSSLLLVILISSSSMTVSAAQKSYGAAGGGMYFNTERISLEYSEKYQLTAINTVSLTTANLLVWSSSSPDIVSVSQQGIVKALGQGTATITAKQIGTDKYARCTVTVQPYVTQSVKLSSAAVSIMAGNGFSLSAVTDPTGRSVVWSSSNSSVAAVSANGYVKAVSEGTAYIKAKAVDSNAYSVCTVTVKEPQISRNISISLSENTIYTGNHCTVKATTSPSAFSVTYKSSDTSVAKVQGGIVTGVSEGRAVITATDSTGVAKASAVIDVTDAPDDNIVLSNTQASVPADKTFLIKSYTSGVSFSSSDTSVATVNNGYIYAKSKGTAIISATDDDLKKTCAITVTDKAPIRFSYSSPNSASLNDSVALVAITDNSRTSVKFKVDFGSYQTEVTATEKSYDSNDKCLIWKGYVKASSAGTFNVTAYSLANGSWSTFADGNSEMFVNNVSNPQSVSFASRRPSDKLLKLNATYEGFLPAVTEDPLVSNAPTLGHGKVVTAGEMFYNNISREEAYAYLVKTMNGGSYTNAVNNFMKSYNIKFNQQQFDALVMLVYNLGSGVLYDSDVLRILTDCVESSGNSQSDKMCVNSSDGLNLRTGPSSGNAIITAMPDQTAVTVLEKTNGTWYKVELSDGTVGYCACEYLVSASDGVVRNMNLVDTGALSDELTLWHHAGGHCVWGLLYRRIDELEIFIYNDYILDGSQNKYNMSYVWHE